MVILNRNHFYPRHPKKTRPKTNGHPGFLCTRLYSAMQTILSFVDQCLAHPKFFRGKILLSWHFLNDTPCMVMFCYTTSQKVRYKSHRGKIFNSPIAKGASPLSIHSTVKRAAEAIPHTKMESSTNSQLPLRLRNHNFSINRESSPLRRFRIRKWKRPVVRFAASVQCTDLFSRLHRASKTGR